jgi:hypothetical protein
MLVNFYARAELQRTGRATDFLKEVSDEYRSKGISFEAVVWEDHPMRHVYCNEIGFEEAGTTDQIHPGSGLRFTQIVARPFAERK